MRYLARRLAFYLLTAWAAVSLNFLIPRMMPGNPAQLLLSRFKATIGTTAIHSFEKLFGLNHASMLSQYATYWSSLFRGNLGISFSYYPSTVTQVIAGSLPWTLALIGIATVLSFVIGTVLGIVVGWRTGSWLDSWLPITTFLASIPYFWLGLLAIYFFSVDLHWFPLAGAFSSSLSPGFSWSFTSSALYYAALPALTIIIASVGGWLLGMRNMMITTLSEDYILMAEAKGLSSRRVKYAYAARNAILPSFANFAMSLGFVVGGALLVEIIFSYPGLGYVLYQAVTNEDYPLMQGCFLIITLAVLLANFFADIAYVVLDPRTRLGR